MTGPQRAITVLTQASRQESAWPVLTLRAELHPRVGQTTTTWMEAGDPPVHDKDQGPLAAPWGKADAVFAARPGVLFSPNPTANPAGVTERIKSEYRHVKAH